MQRQSTIFSTRTPGSYKFGCPSERQWLSHSGVSLTAHRVFEQQSCGTAISANVALERPLQHAKCGAKMVLDMHPVPSTRLGCDFYLPIDFFCTFYVALSIWIYMAAIILLWMIMMTNGWVPCMLAPAPIHMAGGEIPPLAVCHWF